MYFLHMLFEFKLLLPGLCHFLLKLLFLKVQQLLFLFHASQIRSADLSSELQIKVSLGLVSFDTLIHLLTKDHFSFLHNLVFSLTFSNCSPRSFQGPDSFRLRAPFFNHVLVISNSLLGHLHAPVGRVLLLFITLLSFICLKLLVVSFYLVQKLLLMFKNRHLFCCQLFLGCTASLLNGKLVHSI